MMTPHSLTPAEMQDLGMVAARARFYRDDVAPMLRDSDDASTVIPWREAMEIED